MRRNRQKLRKGKGKGNGRGMNESVNGSIATLLHPFRNCKIQLPKYRIFSVFRYFIDPVLS